jgi:hypothetical protein
MGWRLSNLAKKVRRKALVRAAKLLRAADHGRKPLGFYVAVVEQDLFDAVTRAASDPNQGTRHADDHAHD